MKIYQRGRKIAHKIISGLSPGIRSTFPWHRVVKPLLQLLNVQMIKVQAGQRNPINSVDYSQKWAATVHILGATWNASHQEKSWCKKKLQTVGIIIQSMSRKDYVSKPCNAFNMEVFDLCTIDIWSK